MKTSMRKVLVVLLVVGCLLVLGAFKEASAQQAFGPITGTYASTYSSTCLVSSAEFVSHNTQLMPQPGYRTYAVSSSGHAKWTFHDDGTGSTEVSLIYTVFPGGEGFYTPTSVNSQAVSFDFTYSLAKDGAITITLADDSYRSTLWVDGILNVYKQDKVSYAGMVSIDKMSITLNSPKELDFVTRTYFEPAGRPQSYAACHSSHSLIRVK